MSDFFDHHEFQKRGLSHAHILLIVHPDDCVKCKKDIDNAVQAFLPDLVSEV